MISKLINKFNCFVSKLKIFNVELVPKKKLRACACSSSEDSETGKLFKHYHNQKLYKYLFVASTEEDRSKLVVVYQDIEDKLIYTRPFNSFYDEVNGVPRFEEQSC